ncbi:MAG: hypothetical protein AYK23_05245 [Candidatus Proteinoplasmatales archaeon SG8-5]|nr:MAG: hypothetical protein AYK23_05245 [Candidatus Proteinoplasmatales archaeon SG8-5]
MTEIKVGDTVVLYPPVSLDGEFSNWTGREAVVLEEDDPMFESHWCPIQVKGGLMMRAPKKWLKKK